MADNSSAELSEKLDIIIRLQALNLVSRMESQKEKIIFLSKAGMPPRLVGEILNISSNQVSVTLSKEKKTSDTKPKKVSG